MSNVCSLRPATSKEGPLGNIDPGRSVGFVCGPEIMMRYAADALVGLGVAPADIRVSLDRCAELGGTVESEPFDLPAGPTLAFARDPEGNPLVLVQQ